MSESREPKFELSQRVGFLNSISHTRDGNAYFSKEGVIRARYGNKKEVYYSVETSIFSSEVEGYVPDVVLMREDRLVSYSDVSKYNKFIPDSEIRLKVGDTFYVSFYDNEYDVLKIIHIDKEEQYIVCKNINSLTKRIQILTKKEIEQFRDFYLDPDKKRRMTSEHLFY